MPLLNQYIALVRWSVTLLFIRTKSSVPQIIFCLSTIRTQVSEETWWLKTILKCNKWFHEPLLESGGQFLYRSHPQKRKWWYKRKNKSFHIRKILQNKVPQLPEIGHLKMEALAKIIHESSKNKSDTKKKVLIWMLRVKVSVRAIETVWRGETAEELIA